MRSTGLWRPHPSVTLRAADRGQGLRGEGERAGEGGGAPDLSELGRAGRKGAGALQEVGFPFAQPREGQRVWTARRESGGAALVFEPLFSGWKGNDCRGQPFWCSLYIPALSHLPGPALPCPGAAVRFQAPLLTPLPSARPRPLWLCAGPWPSPPPQSIVGCAPLCLIARGTY